MLSYLIERFYGLRRLLRLFKRHRPLWLVNLLLLDLFIVVCIGAGAGGVGVLFGRFERDSAFTALVLYPLIYLLLTGLFWCAYASKRLGAKQPVLLPADQKPGTASSASISSSA